MILFVSITHKSRTSNGLIQPQCPSWLIPVHYLPPPSLDSRPIVHLIYRSGQGRFAHMLFKVSPNKRPIRRYQGSQELPSLTATLPGRIFDQSRRASLASRISLKKKKKNSRGSRPRRRYLPLPFHSLQVSKPLLGTRMEGPSTTWS